MHSEACVVRSILSKAAVVPIAEVEAASSSAVLDFAAGVHGTHDAPPARTQPASPSPSGSHARGPCGPYTRERALLRQHGLDDVCACWSCGKT